MEQRTDEWFAARAGKFTGSRFSDLMARTKSGPAASRAELITTLAIERLTGRCVETYSNAAMQRGIELEPLARSAYEAFDGVMVRESGFVQHKDHSFVGVSPDGLVGYSGMVEIKCPYSMAKHACYLRSNGHAKEYWWQLQGQLWVCGRKWVDAVSFDPRFPDLLQLAIVRVCRDDSAIAELEAECIKANDEVEKLVEELRKINEQR